MSAKGEDVRERFLEQTGAVDSIGKPFDAEALVAVLENALRGEIRLPAVSLEVDEPRSRGDTKPDAPLTRRQEPTPSALDLLLGPASDDTRAFEAPLEIMRRAAISSHQVLPEPPPSGTLSTPSLEELMRVRSEAQVSTMADAFFDEDEMPFSDRASETTQRIDGMSLIANKLAEELTDAFGARPRVPSSKCSRLGSRRASCATSSSFSPS